MDGAMPIQPTPPPEVPESLTAEELAACVAVYRACVAAALPISMLSAQLVIMATLTSKLRIEKTVPTLKAMHAEVFEAYALDPDAIGFDASPNTIQTKWGECEPFWNRYRVCGKDEDGRSIMWIAGGKTERDAEKQLVHTSVLFFLAVHADLATLRGGVTFVIDTTHAPTSKVGNERKLQKTWQSMPLRPQHFYIMGATWFKRLAINALLKFAAVFSNSKVIERIRFADLEEVTVQVGAASLPSEYGGDDRSTVSTSEWVAARLAAYPGATEFAAAVADEAAATDK